MTAQIFALVGAENAVMLARIFGALVIGALILLMLVTVYQNEWMTHACISAGTDRCPTLRV
jgi:hypothetical membrane protein